MQKPLLSVETPFGVFTRRTDRQYRFIVVSQGVSIDRQRIALDREARAWDGYAQEYQQIVDGARSPRLGLTLEDYATFLEEARERARSYREVSDEVLAKRSLKVFQHGWSARRDLAEKVAAKARLFGYQNVTIVEVPQP